MALLLLVAVIGVAVLLMVLADRAAHSKKELESERRRWGEEKELLIFDLELARELAKSGRVYLVESADALVDSECWRPHTFFRDREKAESYRHSMDHLGDLPLPDRLTRIRELTPDDLPPSPEERTKYDHSRSHAT